MKKRGRAPRPPEEGEVEKVKELVAVGAPTADIAKALGRSEPNLRKYFSAYLVFPKKNKPKSDFKPTPAQREKVILYLGCKMTVEDVARVMALPLDEFREAFADELVTARAKYRAKVLEKLDAQMDVGTVGATNRLEALTVIAAPLDKEPGADRQGPNLGKKAAGAAAAAAAAQGGGNFAPPPGPRLAVNNDKPK